MRDVKKLRFTVVMPRGKRSSRTVRADNGSHFTEVGIKDAVNRLTKQLARLVPGVEFRVVKLAANKFNFIHEACDAKGAA